MSVLFRQSTRAPRLISLTPRPVTSTAALQPVRSFHASQIRKADMPSKDPYTQKAETDAPLAQKRDEVFKIISEVKTAMLVSKGPVGLHSRAMAPASQEGLVFEFIYNQESNKEEELQNSPDVNISYFSPSSTSWVSVAGQAKLVDDVEHIKKIWNPLTSAWFGDLGDGKHTGSYDDPRVGIISVKPSSIRYWLSTSNSVSSITQIVGSAITGKTASPGVIRELSSTELEQLASEVGK
ncbi:uncharacterized protein L969DRAFT_23814 [Mixia osmundae IAM 14324]|uniref:General stress protein FMN-binding split barrel domain-containing protein n=1 Tax=Mixia osmundae (strain CBS 9802 / IAM 14324 / JCM 22182 / KY 12970) TaxID=764103 RepID=G7E3G8_MIXOS|nr:uncharacterized protein L969DRAFT_23814 [Mixia osmundae IAM 14324]KEI39365.1 hypothetical protein L969DRAFT_23814 [Mixia osmundae IAM 14324]GAA97378.1 hypothetical protein E5Q_04056 [Mixia osmundae IAM 14324]